jgi:hypothetical protein
MTTNSFFLQAVLLSGALLVSCNNREHEEIEATETGYEKLNRENFISKEDVTNKAVDVFAKLTESVPEAKTATYSEEQAGFIKKREMEQIYPVKDHENVLDAYYVVTYNGGGFAILGADERIPEILAFSEDSDFPFESEEITFQPENETIPLGLRFWLNDMKTAVSLLRSQNVNAFTEGGNIIETYSDEGNGGGLPGSYSDEDLFFSYMLTTKWGQKNGYNQYIPLCSGSQHASTGCGPVALAQIMRFYGFPGTFDWDNMADTYATTATASLLSDIYDATNSFPSSYDICATSTNSDQLYYALSDYGYDNSNYFYPFDAITAKNDIADGKPVLLIANIADGRGHGWVTDGHGGFIRIDRNNPANTQTHHYFHMNWGWLEIITDGLIQAMISCKHNMIFSNLR